MKLPPRSSRQMAIIDTLRTSGPVTLGEGIELHGLPRRVTVADMAELYEELVTMDCLTRIGLHYHISNALTKLYASEDSAPEPEFVATPAPARTPNPFKPLSKRFLVSARGFREGSNDLRDMPSRYCQLDGGGCGGVD